MTFKMSDIDSLQDCPDGSDEVFCQLSGCDCDFGEDWTKGKCGGWHQELDVLKSRQKFGENERPEFGDWERTKVRTD